MNQLEMWGGVECTIRRVGDAYTDQLRRSGHRTRIRDLDRFAELGIKKLRYPVLWEQVAPQSLDKPKWQWADKRLHRLQELDIDPIVGLMHHGSGPRYTALHQDNFASGLARFARMVAERYPWVNHYTPINEPLTTARFSGLYGIWYPHGLDDQTFVRIQLNHIQATKQAMQAIRQVNPEAKLVQTEDLGQTHSTPGMARQAEFENHRRWLTFDLLCGRVDQHHPMWDYLCRSGASAEELMELVSDPLPPDIIGINYYVTSERFLDDTVHHYPEWNVIRGRLPEDYIDIEAVRVRPVQLVGLQDLLAQTWERYKLPIAVTEVQMNCTREEQMRWLHQAWQAARNLQEQGVDVRAVTAWSLLGAFDWTNLLVHDGHSYETGVFDVRSGKPRPTALFKMVQSLARTGEYHHPLLQGEGWWNRDIRFHFHHHAHI
ncbi:family 1 glycosylhydrolase [Hymenobacter sp. BT175]|uniref:family 1 glycosylhydrolase n=1 Tax=Hymenobacter translucens TaxID=2886507 RepID=UPI001D0E14CC|nr:family 1 glycosylhydrolase [Hymenobacter translucens]MCC2548369.1 family 1 glycosylhydrolase [Hymenobacter translucens]